MSDHEGAHWRRAVDAIASRLQRGGLRSKVERDAPLGALTTYRVGGSARLMVHATSEEELRAVRAAVIACTETALVPLPVLVVGKGSNLLVADDGFPGLALRLGGSLADVELPAWRGGDPERLVVRAGGATGLPVLARRTVEAGLAGLEWAVGIPGSVGGALKMNAGGHGSDTASCLLSYRWFDIAAAREGESPGEHLELGYRSSALADDRVIVWAQLAVRRGEVASGKAILSDIVRWRREHQPGGSNAGSVFVNPAGDSAGRLVEAAGLKGFQMGSARVSEKHANFIQADDGGSAADIQALMTYVRRIVRESTGVELRPEVKLVGFDTDDHPGAHSPASETGRASR